MLFRSVVIYCRFVSRREPGTEHVERFVSTGICTYVVNLLKFSVPIINSKLLVALPWPCMCPF